MSELERMNALKHSKIVEYDEKKESLEMEYMDAIKEMLSQKKKEKDDAICRLQQELQQQMEEIDGVFGFGSNQKKNENENGNRSGLKRKYEKLSMRKRKRKKRRLNEKKKEYGQNEIVWMEYSPKHEPVIIMSGGYGEYRVLWLNWKDASNENEREGLLSITTTSSKEIEAKITEKELDALFKEKGISIDGWKAVERLRPNVYKRYFDRKHKRRKRPLRTASITKKHDLLISSSPPSLETEDAKKTEILQRT